MRLEWLEDILAIARTGSFSGAAERRHLTQSAFSRRIQQIEAYVGVDLFDRSHKPVQLRQTTLAQSGQIEHLSQAMRQLVVDLRRGDRIASNKIVIASQHSLATSLVPSVIQGLQSGDDEIYVRLRSANLDECFGLLLSRQAEIAMIFDLADDTGDDTEAFLEEVDIGTDSLIPVFAADHGAGYRNMADGASMPYVAYPSDVFFGKVMERKILPFLRPTLLAVPRVESALTLVALEMAVAGIAVAWVPMSIARDRLSTGKIVDLSGELPSCALKVKAVRLRASHGPVELALWSQLAEMGRRSGARLADAVA